MAKAPGAAPKVVAPDPSRQAQFYQLLLGARKTWLMDALAATLKSVSAKDVKAELAALVPEDVQQILAGKGIRDEHVFPTPTILRANPSLLGYYRLLLGVPRKTFYKDGGRGLFDSMEKRDVLGPRQAAGLDALVAALVEALAGLVRQIAEPLQLRDINDLPLLTLGSYFQGLNNNQIGEAATDAVFLAVRQIVESYIESETVSSITIKNASGRIVTLVRSSDPDVGVKERFGTDDRPTVAIEIKGGTDSSNAHNRAGEAEKSHRKAYDVGYRNHWTIITTEGVDLDVLKRESPTTSLWFDAPQVLAQEGPDWDAFRSRLCGAVGIPE